MKKLLAYFVILNSIFLINTIDLFAGTCNLKLSPNNRFLVHTDGTPFLPTGDTCWQIPWDLTRSEVETYLQTRKDQHFNMVCINSFDWDQGRNSANQYGDQPFVMVSGKYDPSQPITTAGNDPNNAGEYDYWDNLDYIIDLAVSKGMFVVLLPCWGDTRITAGDSSRMFYTESSAYNYGNWIAQRFINQTNIIWMMGGDTVPGGLEAIYRAMAEGVADGENGVTLRDGNADYSTTLMSYHPPKWTHSSSEWFSNDAFMDFNSTQDQPSDQINRIRNDYSLLPTKATWLFEGGYEGRSGTYGSWQCRFQAYQTVFAGGFGQVYGNMSIWDFDSDWASHMNDPGSLDMQHLLTLMTSVTDTQYLTRIPDQSIIDGDTGSMTGSEGIYSTCIVATHTELGDNAMIYSANGRNISVKMNRLAGASMTARWFDPRSGAWTSIGTGIASGTGAPIVEFDPPGSPANGNDYILVLDTEGTPIPPEPVVVQPYVDNNNNRGLLHCDRAVTNLWPSGAANCFITPDDNSSGRQAISPIMNASNDWGIARDDSTMPTFHTNSPYSGDYLAFDGNDSIIVTNAWPGGDNLDLDLSFRFNGLPSSSGDNYAGLLWTLPVKAYLQNTGDDTHGKILMLVYNAAGSPLYFYSSKTLNPNVWYHLSFSASNNNLSVAVGNEDEGYITDTATATGLLSPTPSFPKYQVVIGSDYFGPTRLYHGDMDEVRWGVVVPEPTTLGLLCVLGLAFYRKK